MSLKPPSACEVVERALALSSAQSSVAILEEISEVEVRFANNRTTTNGDRRTRRLAVASIVAAPGAKLAVGVASRTTTGALDEIEALVAASEADARSAPGAEDAMPLITPADLGAARTPGTESFVEGAVETSPGALGMLVEELAEAIARARGSRRVLSGLLSHEIATTYLGTSGGIRSRHVQPDGTLELVERAPDGAGGIASSWAGRATRDLGSVSLLELDDQLARKLSWAKRRVELPAGRYEAILPPDAVADLVVVLYEAACGRDAEDGQNVFASKAGGTRVGDRLFPLGFRLFGDPGREGLRCAPLLVTGTSGADVSVFDNGLGIEATSWVQDGRLERLRYHRAGAARSGVAATPPVDNLVLELPGATKDVEDLVAGTRRGLLLTCLWYIREVDPSTLLLTGLTRDGVYLVEGGEVVGAVNNFRFNESPVDVLARVLEAGATKPALSREWNEWMSATEMPPLRVADFNMSSVSPAS